MLLSLQPGRYGLYDQMQTHFPSKLYGELGELGSNLPHLQTVSLLIILLIFLIVFRNSNNRKEDHPLLIQLDESACIGRVQNIQSALDGLGNLVIS